MRARTAAGQFQDQFKGAMEERSRQGRKGEHTELAVLEYTLVLVSVAVPAMESPPPCKPKERARNVPAGFHWGDGKRYTGFDSRESSPPARQTHGDGQRTSGAMEEIFRQGQKVSTHMSLR